MPKPRKTSLETPTARLRLPIQKRPHWLRLGPGLSLAYRRNEAAGTWSIRAADGKGGEWLKKFATADDFQPADGKQVLNYAQAIAAAHKLVRGTDDAPGDQAKPVTLDAALIAYEADLVSRRAAVFNARAPRKHLSSVLLSKPVPLLDSKELRAWRDSMLAKGLKPASVVRYCKALSAALNAAAAHDPRIRNAKSWQIGLEALPDATVARNVILDDATVIRFVNAAYARDQKLGLLVDTLAVTGSRPSQVSRLLCEDLHGGAKPRLTMPRSGKGGSKNRAARKNERIGVPITLSLSKKLAAAARGRAGDAPLLLQSNGNGWTDDPSKVYREDIREVVASIGRDPDETTLYSLRHSSVVRQLLANTPVRIVAVTHDTSVAMIEKHYSRFIADHSDDVARRGLLLHHDEPSPPDTDNIVALPPRRS